MVKCWRKKERNGGIERRKPLDDKIKWLKVHKKGIKKGKEESEAENGGIGCGKVKAKNKRVWDSSVCAQDLGVGGI